MQDRSFIETVRNNLERLIATQEKLRARISSLNADLTAEKSRAKQHVSERDEALRQAEESAAISARLEAHAKAAQDALTLELERNQRLQQQADAAIQELQSQLTATQRERDDLKDQLAKLSETRHTAPPTEPVAEVATERKAAETVVQFAPPPQPAQIPQGPMAAPGETERPRLDDLERQKAENQTKANSAAVAPRHCVAVTAGRDALASKEQEISALHARLTAAAAGVQGLANDAASQQAPQGLDEAALVELQNLIRRESDRLRQADSVVGDLSRGKETLLSAFASLQGEVGNLKIEQDRMRREIAAIKQADAEAVEAFETVRKKTVELETAAEVLSIRQQLDDFKRGQIGRASLAQHETMLSTTATNLDIVGKKFTTASTTRDRLAGQADSLQGEIAQFTAKFADVNERVARLIQRTDAWLEKAASQRIAPFNEVNATLARIKETAAQDSVAVSASTALVERLNESRKLIESDVGSASETLGELHKSLNARLDRVKSAEADAKGEPAANNSPGTDLPEADCRDRARFVIEADGVRQGLEARLVQVAELSGFADRLTSDLAVHREAESQAKSDLVEISRKHQERLGRIEILSHRIASLSKKQSAHEQRRSAESDAIAALTGQLNALAESLALNNREVRAYRSEAGSTRAAETGEATGIRPRLKTLADRVGLLKAAVVSLKRPPPIPTKPANLPISAPEPDNDQPRMSPPQDADRLEVSCNLALPSCRRWLHLREQQSLKVQHETAGEEHRQHN